MAAFHFVECDRPESAEISVLKDMSDEDLKQLGSDLVVLEMLSDQVSVMGEVLRDPTTKSVEVSTEDYSHYRPI